MSKEIRMEARRMDLGKYHRTSPTKFHLGCHGHQKYKKLPKEFFLLGITNPRGAGRIMGEAKDILKKAKYQLQNDRGARLQKRFLY
jgi:hypothetical protein